jgi:sirohydrochlorin cobaltochelatase
VDNENHRGILVVGHGSRDVEGVEEFRRVAEHLAGRFPERQCATGFLEFATPLISDGVSALVERGARDIIAMPGMLMAAGHAKNDIPSELNTLQAEHPGVRIQYGPELGIHPRMLRAAADRIEAAEAELPDDATRADTLLMVVGRGASDPDANSNIAKITRMLWEGMGFGWAETCYIGVTQPLLADALERTHGLGFRHVVVFPYFLFTGRLIKKIHGLCDEFQAGHPEVHVAKAGYLNDHPQVIETFIERLRETEQGQGNMNCQLCQYREQVIGFEHKVGEAQVGHHHHVRGAGTDAGHHHHHHGHGHHHE